jgi:hypothetical protein
VRRPVRPTDELAKYPAATEGKLKPDGCRAAAAEKAGSRAFRRN